MNIFIPFGVLLIPLSLIGIAIVIGLIYFIFWISLEALDMYCKATGVYKLFVKFMIENKPKKKGRVIMK